MILIYWLTILRYTYGKPLDGDVKVRLENLFYGPYVVNNQTTYHSGTVVQYEQVYTVRYYFRKFL